MSGHISALELAAALRKPPPTPEQQRVIEHPLTSMLVVAGAGSGKTETMAYRVVWLVANGLVAPEEVLGLTFTRKAAGELAERINTRLRTVRAAGLWVDSEPPESSSSGVREDGAAVEVVGPTVSTYNAYAGRLVGEHGLRLGVEPDAGLLGEALAWQLADACVTEYVGPMDAVTHASGTVTGEVLSLSGQLAEHLCDTATLTALLARTVAEVDAIPLAPRKRSVPESLKKLRATCAAQLQMLPLVHEYALRKRERSVIDFADQVQLAARLSMEFPNVARAERRRYKVVLLDEFQDTSEAQMRLLQSLFAPRADLDEASVPVVAVGDPHQSIYGWRGASATTLNEFPTLFGGPADSAQWARTPTLPLSTSWRNDESILTAANTVAAELSATTEVDVATLSARPGAGPGTVEVARLETYEDEARAVAAWIEKLWWDDTDTEATDTGTEDSPSRPARQRSGATAAVLCRRRSQFPSIVEALREAGLPVEVVGLGGLLMVPEVTDTVALLGSATDPGRSDLLMRLLTSVCRLGAHDIDLFGEWAKERDRAAQPSQGTSPPPERPEPAGLIEALDSLPPASWQDRHGRRFSTEARSRLQWLAAVVRQVRAASGQPLPELLTVAERALGLEVELLSRPGATPASARAHLDALAEVVAGFSASASQATPGDLLAYLDAAAERERGLEMPITGTAAEAVNVLTVHAAKGLEWDVVAVPGMVEGGFPTYPGGARTSHDGESWQVSTPKSRGWTSEPGALPYPLRGDRAGLPSFTLRGLDSAEADDELGRFAKDGGAHAMLEERRLAYVAVTRAARALLLTASVWEQQNSGTATPRPRVTSRFLEEIATVATVRHWHPMPDANGTHPLAVDEQHPWPRRRDSARAEDAALVRAFLEAPSPDAVPAVHDALSEAEQTLDTEMSALLAEWSERRRADTGPIAVLPDHVTSTDLVRIRADEQAYAADLRRPMPRPPSGAAHAGSEFHAWLEQRFRAPVLTLDGDDTSMDDLLVGAEVVTGPETVAQTNLETWKANFLASEWADRTPIEVEFPVEVVIDSLPVRGRIDAVFSRPGGGVEIVDWKSGRIPAVEHRAERTVQLALYAVAYAQLKGLPVEAVSAAFFYAADGVTVRPQLPGRNELTEWIASIGR